MRTYGAHLLGLRNFAAYASGHDQGQWYLRDSGAVLAAGHTMQVGEHEYLRIRNRT